MNIWKEARSLRVLNFDTESRPLAYLGSDFTTGEITAIAASWLDEQRVRTWLLGRHTSEEMLRGFLGLYTQADLVTGHFIRKHDLPILSGAMLEFGLGPLPPKLTSDTCLDLVKHKQLSGSQESLARMYGLSHSKEHMAQPMWREANRLTPTGIKLTRLRVINDVRQNKALRAKLVEMRALGPPKMWHP